MHALITTPSAKGMIHYETSVSVFRMQEILLEKGYDVDYELTPFTDIVEARNRPAARLLAGETDLLIGIDDDVGVTEEAFNKMLNADVDYIGACIPQRMIDLAAYNAAVRQGMPNRDAQEEAAPLVDSIGVAWGISKVRQIGTGFFILRPRPLNVLVKMQSVTKRTEIAPRGKVEEYGFFDNHYDANGVRLSEDYSFCKRLREANIDVHAYKGRGVSHSGEMTFHS